MIFQNNMPFIEPPEMFRGTLVLESDDGRIGDYTHWMPLLKTKTQKSKWHPFRYNVSACTAVITDWTGTEGFMTTSQLHELVDNGWEMLNHGAAHIGMLVYTLSTNATAGDTVLQVAYNGMKPKYAYRITDTTTQATEIIQPLSVDDSTITLTSPLKNNYSIHMPVDILPEHLDEDVNGSLATLTNWGLDVKHLVVPYHLVGPAGLAKIKENHLTARSTSVGNTNPLPIVNLIRLNGELAGTYNDDAKIEGLVDQIHSENSIGIFYGHGETYGKGSTLDKIVDYAIKKKVRIMTRNEAYLAKMV